MRQCDEPTSKRCWKPIQTNFPPTRPRKKKKRLMSNSAEYALKISVVTFLNSQRVGARGLGDTRRSRQTSGTIYFCSLLCHSYKSPCRNMISITGNFLTRALNPRSAPSLPPFPCRDPIRSPPFIPQELRTLPGLLPLSPLRPSTQLLNHPNHPAMWFPPYPEQIP